MLGRVKRDEVAVLPQQHAGFDTPSVGSGLICNQTNAFALQNRIIALLEDIDAEIDRGVRDCGKGED
jgi:hypothetical protein